MSVCGFNFFLFFLKKSMESNLDVTLILSISSNWILFCISLGQHRIIRPSNRINPLETFEYTTLFVSLVRKSSSECVSQNAEKCGNT